MQTMRMTLRQLKRLIHEALSEGEGWASPPQPVGSADAVGDINTREQLGKLKDRDEDTEDDEQITSHLREPAVEPEDTWGPVPPVAPDPYVAQDPFTRDWSVLPTPALKR
jgi:hypothetical protein